MTPSDGIAEIRAAEQASTLHAGLAEQAEAAQRIRDAAQARVTVAEGKLSAESNDVEKLESFSFARIKAALSGNIEDDLAREKAERQAAEYAVAEARERLRGAQSEVESVAAQLRDLGDVTAQLRQAEQIREQFLLSVGGGAGERLTALAREMGVAQGRGQQVDEALQAAHHAAARLGEAHALLGNARSWASWDTFGGGGLITDMMKYDKIDKAAQLMRSADGALVHLSRELADVGVAGVGGIGITELSRGMDVWFDNIFSDWAVRDRIIDAAARVNELGGWVNQMITYLTGQRTGVEDQIRALVDERNRLIAF